MADLSNFENWQDGGSKTCSERATQIWKNTLAEFKELPTGGHAVIERLQPYIEKLGKHGGAPTLDYFSLPIILRDIAGNN